MHIMTKPSKQSRHAQAECFGNGFEGVDYLFLHLGGRAWCLFKQQNASQQQQQWQHWWEALSETM
jgi:hypothetical protein